MIAGGGLSITGAHTMCGDYLYSGHTVMLTLTYLFIKECEFHNVYNSQTNDVSVVLTQYQAFFLHSIYKCLQIANILNVL